MQKIQPKNTKILNKNDLILFMNNASNSANKSKQ